MNRIWLEICDDKGYFGHAQMVREIPESTDYSTWARMGSLIVTAVKYTKRLPRSVFAHKSPAMLLYFIIQLDVFDFSFYVEIESRSVR